jgi:hypothetical protein
VVRSGLDIAVGLPCRDNVMVQRELLFISDSNHYYHVITAFDRVCQDVCQIRAKKLYPDGPSIVLTTKSF